jgi:hypothetical protein
MRSLITLVLTLVVAGAAQAQDASFDAAPIPAPTHRESPAPSVVSTQSPQETRIEMRTVEARELVNADADAAALPTRRGSFWWFVAVLVVAGVILAVLL